MEIPDIFNFRNALCICGSSVTHGVESKTTDLFDDNGFSRQIQSSWHSNIDKKNINLHFRCTKDSKDDITFTIKINKCTGQLSFVVHNISISKMDYCLYSIMSMMNSAGIQNKMDIRIKASCADGNCKNYYGYQSSRVILDFDDVTAKLESDAIYEGFGIRDEETGDSYDFASKSSHFVIRKVVGARYVHLLDLHTSVFDKIEFSEQSIMNKLKKVKAFI